MKKGLPEHTLTPALMYYYSWPHFLQQHSVVVRETRWPASPKCPCPAMTLSSRLWRRCRGSVLCCKQLQPSPPPPHTLSLRISTTLGRGDRHILPSGMTLHLSLAFDPSGALEPQTPRQHELQWAGGHKGGPESGPAISQGSHTRPCRLNSKQGVGREE